MIHNVVVASAFKGSFDIDIHQIFKTLQSFLSLSLWFFGILRLVVVIFGRNVIKYVRRRVRHNFYFRRDSHERLKMKNCQKPWNQNYLYLAIVLTGLRIRKRLRRYAFLSSTIKELLKLLFSLCFFGCFLVLFCYRVQFLFRGRKVFPEPQNCGEQQFCNYITKSREQKNTRKSLEFSLFVVWRGEITGKESAFVKLMRKTREESLKFLMQNKQV
jgi:hypothetical protein